MIGKIVVVLILVFCMVYSPVAIAAELVIKSGDTVQKILEGQKGKRVTVRMQGNEELTGKVRMVTKELLHLGELTGKEYFDAVIDINRVSAVIVRVKE